MSFSNYLENKLLDHLFGKSVFTPPAVYVALSTADPLDDGSGLAEPGVGSYARVLVLAANWNVAASGITDNNSSIIFPMATAPWGIITHVALIDALVAGNILGSGALSAPISVLTNDIPQFAPNNLTITLT